MSLSAVVVVVGPMPPPVNGLAVVTEAMYRRLVKTGACVGSIDVAAKTLDRGLLARLTRVPVILRSLTRLVRMDLTHCRYVYMSVSGGLGKLYEILFAIVARSRGCRLALHHHSFGYLDNRDPLLRLLTSTAGPSALHITLSPGMDARLRGHYQIARSIVISNAAFIEAPLTQRPDAKLTTIGFMSSSWRAKGAFCYLDLMQRVADMALPLKGRLAGSGEDARTDAAVREQIAQMHDVTFDGPVYGSRKDQFFTEIDVLVFPSSYVHEAEPLTILEALAHGVPVIAYGRGAIPEILTPDTGLVIEPTLPFVPRALSLLERWFEHQDEFLSARVAARGRFERLRASTEVHLGQLLNQLTSGQPG